MSVPNTNTPAPADGSAANAAHLTEQTPVDVIREALAFAPDFRPDGLNVPTEELRRPALAALAALEDDRAAAAADAAAVHIDSPWLTGTALCGESRGFNSVTLTDPRPDSVEGCWTCLYAADWLAAAEARAAALTQALRIAEDWVEDAADRGDPIAERDLPIIAAALAGGGAPQQPPQTQESADEVGAPDGDSDAVAARFAVVEITAEVAPAEPEAPLSGGGVGSDTA